MIKSNTAFIGVTVHVDSGRECDLYPNHPLLYVERDTINLIHKMGLIPYLIPVYEDGSLPPLDHLSAIIFTGGGFLSLSEPNSQLSSLETTGQERYKAEQQLIHYGLNKDLPMIGFCRGAQMINDALGGSLANIPDTGVEHHQEKLGISGDQIVHRVKVEEDSLFYSLTGQTQLGVNSFHRQHMNKLGTGLRLAATSMEDGIVEIFESKNHKFVFGFQFHPEKMVKNNQVWQTFFKNFANQIN
ncbi:gamma-glutamyl-gamma-aminobutyrate hydrolase family protein [Neobacillus niacini]|uniref:gamma-glutamyl-gamma-aminobutyrate hydrolase family protein n=1 Tax=Neobacillus niacini TaxID=86668 RepID=UPI00203C12FE|nr:gamma-glutamyl-gamma-aminobutyrate hydrolase family protein [Neobacillus niacini]